MTNIRKIGTILLSLIMMLSLFGAMPYCVNAEETPLGVVQKREKTLEIKLELPKSDKDITIKVYVDGQLDSSKETTVDSSVEFVNYKFNGTKGTKEVKFKFNNGSYKIYELDFDNEEVTLISESEGSNLTASVISNDKLYVEIGVVVVIVAVVAVVVVLIKKKKKA